MTTDNERGIALISVLWIIVVIALIASTMLALVVSQAKQVSLTGKIYQGEAIADAAIYYVLAHMMDSRIDRRFNPGQSYSYKWKGQDVSITIDDEFGKIDINHAPDIYLEALFRWAGQDEDTIPMLIDSIADWRDSDKLKRPKGAENNKYHLQPFKPANGPFEHIGDLSLVNGITSVLYDRISPLITVYSGRSVLDPQHAPDDIKHILNQISIFKRKNSRPNTQSFDGHTFVIHAKAVIDGMNISRRAAIRFSGDPFQPYWVLAWE